MSSHLDDLDGQQFLEWDDVKVATDQIEPYILSWQVTDSPADVAECTALVLMKRAAGVLLVLPPSFLPEETVLAGNLGDPGAVVGPSLRLKVPTVISEQGQVLETGEEVEALVVDCTSDVLYSMRPFDAHEEITFGYNPDSPFAYPAIEALLPAVRDWALGSSDARAVFYSPAEEDLTPVGQKPRRKSVQPKAATPTDGGSKPKRVTTASLATDLQGLMATLPSISSQLQTLVQRQDQMEARLARPQGSLTQLAAPQELGASLNLPQASQADVMKALGPPPRTATRPNLGMLASPLDARPDELQALELEKRVEPLVSGQTSDGVLAQAILAQSQALTSLVNQIAQAQTDPMSDLSGSSSTSSTRGAAGRAKLQQELAMQKGTYFKQVMMAMSRRMAPTSTPEVSAQQLLDRGVSGVRYLERFGGYGKNRELGQLQYQVMSIFDHMMAGNTLAAMDGIALLAVTIDQANLDGGRMELATLLCLQEDPPSALFVNRHLTVTSRARAFTPLADQRWITCALAYLKEIEVISAKRLEMTGGGARASDTSSEPNAKQRPKAKPSSKKKGRGKGWDNTTGGEEAETA